MKKLVALPAFITMLFTSVFAETNEDLLQEIVSIEAVTEENKARLQQLMTHPQEDVQNNAKLRLARLNWRSGQTEQAEALLNTVTKNIENYDRDFQIRTWIAWSSFENHRNNYVEAQAYAQKAVDLAEPDSELLPMAYLQLGNGYRNQFKWLQARKYYELALEVFQRREDTAGEIQTYGSLGVLYINIGDFATALKYLHDEKALLEQLDDKGGLASSYSSIGEIYLDSGEPQKAYEYIQKALEIDLEIGDKSHIAHDYVAIAYTFFDQGMYPKALQNNQQAVQQLVQINAPQELSRAYLQQSHIYKKLGDKENWVDSLNLAKKSAEEANVPHQSMAVKKWFGTYHYEQQEYQQALAFFQESLDIAESLTLERGMAGLKKQVAKTYQQLGQTAEAYRLLSQATELEQKLNTEDQRDKTERYKRDLNLLEEQLKVSQLEQTKVEQEQALQAQAEVQKRFYTMAGIVTVLLLAGMFVLWQRRQLSLLRVKLYEDALEQKQQLFADVSHELRTPLTALKLQIEALENNLIADVQSGYQKLSKKVSEINRLIADIYQLAKADSLSMDLQKKECELTTLFNLWQQDWAVLVESAGFAWRCQLDVANASLMMDADRIKQVIDNLLSNSTFYTDTPGQIALAAKYKNHQLVVSVQDSAPTVAQDKLEKIFTRLYRIDSSRSRQTGGSGLGLAICESLIKAHGGEIRAEQSELGGLKVTFRI